MSLQLLRQATRSPSLTPLLAAKNATLEFVSAGSIGSKRGYALQGMKGYDDKEAAEERLFFKKEDEKLLRELLSKVRAQAEAADPHSATGTLAAERSALEAIVGGKLSDVEKEAVLKWKHTHF